MNINPGTVAAIAASLMAQGENLAEDSEIFLYYNPKHRPKRVKEFVGLAWDIAQETEKQNPRNAPPSKIV